MRGAEREDTGLTIAHGMAALLAFGVPPEKAWPYDLAKFADAPDAEAYGQASASSEIEYARVDGLDHIKGALAREQPVVFSISLPDRCYQEAERTGAIPVPTDEELKSVNKLPERSRVARMLKPAQDIPGIKHKLTNDLLGHRGPAKPIAAVKMLDNETMVYCTDGSLRHAAPHIKGKAARKALKRAKRR